ncbi:MAG: ABC transporter substrate-binding protein [Planctomycetes bacterium]|nr:ABC transporter substrate-binding protein [Planctomycetota bacterium]
MRPLPTLLLSLAAVAALGLGLYVMGANVPAALPGSGDKPAWNGGVPQGHVYTTVCDEPIDVNPLTAHTSTARRMVHAFTHEALLDVDPASGEMRPALASAFEPAVDGMSCTFTVRQGVKFADGEPMTLEDVLLPWHVAHAGHLPLGLIGDVFQRVAAVEVLDSWRFRVVFRERHYASVRIVGESWLVPSKRFFEARVAAKCGGRTPPAIDSDEFATLLGQVDLECGPGTGPYQLRNEPGGTSHWRPRQDLLLVRNDHCWRRSASPGCWNFTGIRLLFREPPAARNALLRGEIDSLTGSTIDSLLAAQPDLTGRYDRLVYDHEQMGVYRVVWNLRHAPCDDLRVRRALAALFDAEGVVATSQGHLQRAVAHAKPDAPAYPRDLAPFAFDPPAARAALREAGYDPAAGRPLRLRFVAMAGTDELRRMVELFADAANKAGIDLSVRNVDMAGWTAAWKANDWDGLLTLTFFRPWGDPTPFLHSRGVDNLGQFADAEVDRLLEQAVGELDATARASAFRAAHKRAFELQPVTLLAHPQVTLLLSRSVQGEAVGRTGLLLERAYVEHDRQRK